MTEPPDLADGRARHLRALAGAVTGVLAAAVAMGAAQFASGLGVTQSSPVLAVTSGAAAAAAAFGTLAGRNLTDEHNVAAADG